MSSPTRGHEICVLNPRDMGKVPSGVSGEKKYNRNCAMLIMEKGNEKHGCPLKTRRIVINEVVHFDLCHTEKPLFSV